MVTNPKKVVKDLLEANWKNANTDRITPKVVYATDQKRLDFSAYCSQISIYRPSPRVRKANGIGKATVRQEDPVTIDIMTTKSEDHAENLLNEVERIINSKIILPEATIQWIDPDEDVQVLHDKTREFWRFVKEIKLMNGNLAR